MSETIPAPNALDVAGAIVVKHLDGIERWEGVPNAYVALTEAIEAAILSERDRAAKAATDTATLLLGESFADAINGYLDAAIRSPMEGRG